MRPNKRITYIHQYFKTPNEPGGTRSWEFACRLAEDGHAVTVITSGPKNVVKELAPNLTVRYLSGDYSNGLGYTARVMRFLSFMARSTLAGVAVPADIVLATSTPLTVAIPGIIASFIRRAKFVFEVRDLWPSVPIELGIIKNPVIIYPAKMLERLAYASADHIIALSPDMERGVREVNAKAKITLVPNASDVELFKKTDAARQEAREKLGWNDGRPTVVYAGSFGETYLIPWIVELSSKLPDVRFVILGEGRSTQEARNVASRLGLDVDALLPGTVAKTEIVNYISGADVTMSSLLDTPALHANSLNKVFDSLAAGTPVVFNHGGWLPGLLSERGAGWRISSDLTSAAAELEAILAASEELNRAREAAEKLAAEEFDRDLLYQKFKVALGVSA